MNNSTRIFRTTEDRYSLFLRGTLLITAGSLIAVVETFIAIYLGLHHVSYTQAILVTIFVIIMSVIFVSVSYFRKNMTLLQEWLIFGTYLLIFQIGFGFWVFRLGELRFLAIINALTSIIILLSYTNIIQSFLISLFVLTNYFTVTWYSITKAGQPGSIIKETFFSLCLIPTFMLVAYAAHYITKKREDLESAKNTLEELNSSLSNVNSKLKKEQKLSEIEMELASEIQDVLFPREKPHTAGWEIDFLKKPYSAVSGDFYDFYTHDNRLSGLSLFDVSGHGVAPALITILAKPVIYTNFKKYNSSHLGDVLRNANEELIDELETVNLYITGIILRINENEVEYVNAGHPDIIHLQSKTHKLSDLAAAPGFLKGQPLGISASGQDYRSARFNVGTGDFLILYSDGLTESRNITGEQFGVERLNRIMENFHSETASEMLNHIINHLIDFTGSVRAEDDITVIVARKL